MSGHNEIDQTVRGDQNGNDSNAILNCVDNTRNQMTPKDYNACLQGMGKDSARSLPSIELFDAKSDVPPPPVFKGPDTSDAELAKAGIKREQGKENTSVVFPNGVDITTPSPSETMDGRKVTYEPIVTTKEPTHETHKGSGMHVDSHNKPVYSDNNDGSKTVYTPEGVYVARPDGTVQKQLAVKNRDGSWDTSSVQDPNAVLGGLDMSKANQPKKSH